MLDIAEGPVGGKPDRIGNLHVRDKRHARPRDNSLAHTIVRDLLHAFFLDRPDDCEDLQEIRRRGEQGLVEEIDLPWIVLDGDVPEKDGPKTL